MGFEVRRTNAMNPRTGINKIGKDGRGARCIACYELIGDGDKTKIARVRYPTHVQPKKIHADHAEDADGTVPAQL